MVDKPTVPIVIFLMGPTAVGKSTVAEHLFESLDAELISVDSGQIYRGMDIGTAKPDQELLQRVPHHLIDIREITESYSVAKFRDDALTLIEKIIAKGKTPLLVGGTMFYFSVLENGISKLPGGDPEVRSEIEQIVQEKGLLYLHQKLTEVDPISAKRIKTQDTQRLKRAYEIFTITGQPPSSVIAESCPQNLQIQYRKIALFRPREILHKRIEVRFMDMIERGLVSEVEGLAKSIRKPEILPSMRSVGYRQVIDYLYGKLTDTEMIEKGVASTRQLAKRQLTWLRNQSNVAWVNAENSNLEKMIVKYLESMNIHADRT
ncbi:MAG: tRNA (adenosine(37)-N6)-dimethylallyltransferase MiaA [Gammaproteobacteria bacterium]|nr:tRNA (adenosine(37)-N6)-dimethylallyltransferase MiaA [Gammaproteobacteria bacterium]MCY4218614.1 tRNA (adenosine(37)-N6)-dimethylallyltransferase MiaA [Gammaproteobacteria bacterium]